MSGAPAAALGSTLIGGRPFAWGERTYVMGIVNITPDSFSGDGLVAARPADPVVAAVELATRMAAEGADLLDVGGESTRPGHAGVDEAEELRRVVPVVAAIHAAQPDLPISVDTTKPAVAAAALEAGAALINDIWGVADDDALARLAAERGVPIVLMHNRLEPTYRDLMTEIVADLEAALERALRAGCSWESLLIDPGFGFGKTADHNLVLLRELDRLRVLRPADPAGHVAQVDPRAGPRPAARAAARGDPGHDRPGRSPRAPTSCECTTSRPTSGRPAWPTSSSGAGSSRERPDRPQGHGVHGPPRRAGAGAAGRPAVPRRRRAEPRPPAGRGRRRPGPDGGLRPRLRDLPEHRGIDQLPAASRPLPRRSPTSSWPTSPSTRSPSGCASPTPRSRGEFAYAGVEIRRRRDVRGRGRT